MKARKKKHTDGRITGTTPCDPTAAQLRDHIRRLQRELFCLCDYLGQEGLWSDAMIYLSDHADTPTPFELM